MEFTIWTQQRIEISDDDIAALCEGVNSRFDTPDAEVFPEDLITQAMIDNKIDELPEVWKVDDSESEEMIDPKDYK